ncbi:MAG: Lrp/AsnC family transcriptional regulator [Burkholderiaceae bacterium]|nr:Lrp/AsnC family transcriptional regulator [Burkholderiaceae bacterium]
MHESFMIELDAIDRRLLDLLQADASRSNVDLAAAAGVSPATALRRVKRLVDGGVAFEARALAEEAVQQCYRVSPGPDFVLVLWLPDMPAYDALVRRLFTQDANVRNVRAYFAVQRSKFDPRIRLPA